ncbi:MAG TPA: type II toxin-antitoxin system VapB family antitoxin [Actinomycetota bacterium]
MGRTNVVLDDELVEQVMRLYGLQSKREAIDFALRRAVGLARQRTLRELKGVGWEGDLKKIRRARSPDR